MATLSFNARFADRVQRGEKLHSIRAHRKRPDQWLPGKTLHLFTAMRTKQCRRLGVATITSIHHIDILHTHIQIDEASIHNETELHAFACADGFNDWYHFVNFFDSHYGLPWSGSLIKWQLQKQPASPNARRARHDKS